MGLIKAITGAAGGVLADQWKEYFYCESLPADTLLVKGSKRVSGRSSNTKASDNIITADSVIAVADGQCMIIVEQGKVVEVCAEPGEFVFDASTEPTVFAGDLATSVTESLMNLGKRFTFGGEPPKDQRVYYVNTKELVGNKYGTASPVPFKIVDQDTNFKFTMNVKCFGEYSYRVCDPVLLYTNVMSNVTDEYKRDQLDGQLKSELLNALQPAFARLSAQRIEYDQVPAHTVELTEYLNEELSSKWRELRGIEIVSMGMNSIVANEEDEERLKQMQMAAVLGGGNMAMGYSVAAAGESMRDAALNEGGAMNAFMGMGAANMFGSQMVGTTAAAGAQAVAQPAQPAADAWACSCGASNTGKFCSECGAAKPAPAGSWTCACGAVSAGKFCPECGAAKPVAACPKCGWQAEGAAPKFCPECGAPFGA